MRATPARASLEDLMDLAVAIAQANAERARGPFGAVVADADGAVVEVGWNAVLAATDSTAHAEIVAIRRAERALGRHELGGLSMLASCAPCIQCYGAIYWSGLADVYAAARRDDAEALGFREGPVTPQLWKAALDERGVRYHPSFRRSRAALQPFATYREKGGARY